MTMVKMITMFAVFTATMNVKADVIHTYDSEQTISSQLAGNDSVVVNCPQGKFVTFTGDNSFTGGMTVQRGGVVLGHVNAFGAGDIVCHSGTVVRINVSYRSSATTLKTLIERIKVRNSDGTEPVAGQNEPWVSFQVSGDGANNDVDFQAQPYLWLGAATKLTLNGIFTPCDNVYKFGYTGITDKGLAITNLVDNGTTPRSVILRGTSITYLHHHGNKSTYTWTGDTIVESGAILNVASRMPGLSTINGIKRNVFLRDGSTFNGSYVRYVSEVPYPENEFSADVRFDISGTVTFSMYGGINSYMKCWGPITGDGEILCPAACAQYWFLNDNNTFTGTLETQDRPDYPCEIYIGDGDNFSWQGSKIVQCSTTNHIVVLNSNKDCVLPTQFLTKPLVGGYVNKYSNVDGVVVKRGSGTITFAAEFMRYNLGAGTKEHPTLDVEDGAVKFTQGRDVAFGLTEKAYSNSGEIEVADNAVIPVPKSMSSGDEGGAIGLASASLYFSDVKYHPYWTLAYSASSSDGGATVVLISGKRQKGSINSFRRFDVRRKWKLSFDYHTDGRSWGGYGFVLGLHNDGTEAHWGEDTYYDKKAVSTKIYGMKFNIRPSTEENYPTHLAWLKNGSLRSGDGISGVYGGAIVDFSKGYYESAKNNALEFYCVDKLKDNPMHVEMAYDGVENMVVTLTQGETVLSTTNSYAKADIDSLYKDGAYFGILGKSFGGWNTQFVKNVSLLFDDEVKEPNKTISGKLKLKGGTVSAYVDAEPVTATIAADFEIVGATTLSSETDGNALNVSSSAWTFDMTKNPVPVLALTGEMTFASSPITLDFEGEIPTSRTLIVDMTGLAGASRPAFTKSPTLAQNVIISVADDKVYVSEAVGTIIIIK